MADQTSETPSVVTFSGPLPPPVTGMTAMMAVIVRALQNEGPVRCYNWSINKPLKGISWKLARAWGVHKTLLGLMFGGSRQGRILYYPANSSWGMIYDIVIATVGRVRGYRLVLHHHAYSYIDRHDWRMALLDKLVGKHGVHAVHCQKMMDDYRAQYHTKATFLIVPPTIVSQELACPRRQVSKAPNSKRPFVLGFLSNLTLAKGLEAVLETFEDLATCGLDVRLILAGPCMQKAARSLVEQATNRWPHRIEYRGPVYGDQKTKFFTEIDVFLFPTQYKNESWGIVLTEALAYGCPVIAYDRGCVSHIIRNNCGQVVPRDEAFVPAAVDLIKQWTSDAELYQRARQQALLRYQELDLEATSQLPAFVRGIRSLR